VADEPEAAVSAVGRLRYEIVFDCRDRVLGERLCGQLEDVLSNVGAVSHRAEDGPTWAVTAEFGAPEDADEFFRGDLYRQFCVEVRRSCQSSVLVVPFGPVEG
jgi:hypothetical protein